MGGDAHRDKHDEEVDPDGGVGDPAIALEGADLADDEADECEDHTADCVAELELGDFGEGLAAGDDDQADGAEELY